MKLKDRFRYRKRFKHFKELSLDELESFHTKKSIILKNFDLFREQKQKLPELPGKAAKEYKKNLIKRCVVISEVNDVYCSLVSDISRDLDKIHEERQKVYDRK